jgi:hypothetical protein
MCLLVDRSLKVVQFLVPDIWVPSFLEWLVLQMCLPGSEVITTAMRPQVIVSLYTFEDPFIGLLKVQGTAVQVKFTFNNSIHSFS